MEKKLNFQTVVLVIFGVGIVIGVGFFSGIIPAGKPGAGGDGLSGTVTIWGFAPPTVYGTLAKGVDNENEDLTVRYVQKDPATYDRELTQALAEGSGPDLFFITNETVIEHRNKALNIPFENYPLETYQANFVDEAGIFITPEGVLAFPTQIDPMVMYYNKDLLQSSFIIDPPEYWDELFTLAPQLTAQTDGGLIQQSAVALGAFDNIDHAKDIFALIMLQSGNPLIGYDDEASYDSYFESGSVANSALRFLSVFSNPAQAAYSWNPSLPSSRSAFLAGDLAFYFGYASELQSLRAQNPNLNFDVSLMLQTRDRPNKLTHGRITGIAISKVSQNIPAAFTVANTLSSSAYGQSLSDGLLLPPVQKELLRQKPNEAFRVLFNNSALIARSWLDPDPEATDSIIRDMIQDSVSGLLSPGAAVKRANAGLESLLES
jgi:ABC-type glycerol-3-phosphate transport system substrate-binding protein